MLALLARDTSSIARIEISLAGEPFHRPMSRPRVFLLSVLGAALLAGSHASAAPDLPRPDHTVVVVMENHSYSDIIGSASAPYINSLRTMGASFTQSFGVGHPSEPNYLALFAGTTEGLTDDSCPHSYADSNLGSELIGAGLTFAGYSESMPATGYTGCASGNYARRHNPWVNFTNVPATANRTFAEFPTDFRLLPTVSFVVPDLCSDMHDCSVATGDAWLRAHIDPYLQWAQAHDSLLVLTFDESDPANQITTIFVGPMVRRGDVPDRVDHYSVLRTLEDMYGVLPTGRAASSAPIASAFLAPTPTPTPTAEPRRPIAVSRTPRPPGAIRFRTP
jgi:hypothetical protein